VVRRVPRGRVASLPYHNRRAVPTIAMAVGRYRAQTSAPSPNERAVTKPVIPQPSGRVARVQVIGRRQNYGPDEPVADDAQAATAEKKRRAYENCRRAGHDVTRIL